MSDNGPQYSCEEFQKFAKCWDFEHVTSSPGHSQSNGKAESAVKSAKRLITKSIESKSDPFLALLDVRNTPTQGMSSSPVQRLMSRRTRSLLPTLGSLLKPQTCQITEDKIQLQQAKNRQAHYYNENAHDLKPLSVGDTVRMKPFQLGQKRWKKGQVMDRLENRSYRVQTDTGIYRRNRVHLRRTQESMYGPNPGHTTDEDQPYRRRVEHQPAAEVAVEQQEPVQDRPIAPEQNANPEHGLPPVGTPRRSARVGTRPTYLKDYVR